jgi:hypothetical protein
VAEVIAFPNAVARSETPAPDADVVEILESYLLRAAAGESASIVIIATSPDGAPECAIRSADKHAIALLGAMTVAERRIASRYDE